MSFISTSKYAKRADAEQVNLANNAFNMVQALRREGVLTPDAELGKIVVSNESFSDADESRASEMLENLSTSVESFFKSANVSMEGINHQQAEAVSFALASAMNPRAHITRSGNVSEMPKGGPMHAVLVDHGGIDPRNLPAATLEAYDTKPNNETMQFTAAFALATAQQNSFGEMFYKTINLSPDQYAIEMEIPLISVYDQLRHELEKRLLDFNRRNIVNAEIDHTILKNDTLKVIPVVRTQTADAFVDPALIAPYAVTNEEGETFNTSVLKTNYRASLFRLAQTDSQLAKGVLDQTDALDPGAVLTAVYLHIVSGTTNEVIRISTKNLPTNQFVESAQGHTRLMSLQFTTDSVSIGQDPQLFNGATSTLLTGFLGSTAHQAWLTFSVRGDINLQDSSYEIITGSVVVNTLKNAAGQTLDLADPANIAIVDLLTKGKIIGFDVDVSKVNSNLRELGQLADFYTYRQTYGVSLGSPLSVQRPITNGDSQDALHAAALSYMCKVRQSNKAVEQLLSEIDTLKQYSKRNDIVGRQPEIMGISAYLVEPTIIEVNLDLMTGVTTSAQHQRHKDITSMITDTIRIVAYRMWQQSNWQAAANLLEGAEAQPPVVKIGSDMVLSQYIMCEGDTRTAGPDFTYEKAWTPDLRVRNRIFIAFGYPNTAAGVPHPLDHGMMLNKPEVVAALNLSRSSHSRELIVHPSFRHIPLCPVLGVVNVTNLDAALADSNVFKVTVI